MNRSEHLEWAKKRALDYLKRNDTRNAYVSFISDMEKHDELKNHMALEIGSRLLISGNLTTASEMKNWIEGFN